MQPILEEETHTRSDVRLRRRLAAKAAVGLIDA
jgi:hypothetical protein